MNIPLEGDQHLALIIQVCSSYVTYQVFLREPLNTTICTFISTQQ